jgi:hypothetical protein
MMIPYRPEALLKKQVTRQPCVSLGTAGTAIVGVGMVTLLMLTPVALETAIAQTPENFDPPRTPWNHPDLRGIWTSNAVTGVPAERRKATLTAEDIERFTLEDPRAFTRSSDLSIPLHRDDSNVIDEYACHEGNYGMSHMLSAALKNKQ